MAVANEHEPDLPQGTLAEQLAQQFYHWECRGRGWLLWDDPVRPEPPFRPFNGYRFPEPPGGDDGRQHTWVSRFIHWISRSLAGQSHQQHPTAEQDFEDSDELNHIALHDQPPLSELQITVPTTAKVDIDTARQLLLSLAACRHSLSFEVLGLPDETIVQLACANTDIVHVRSQLQAHFPESSIKEHQNLFASHWHQLDAERTAIVEFGLSQEFILPLTSASDLDADIMVALAGAMEQVEEGELALLQVIFQSVRHKWAQSILRAVATPDGDEVFGGLINLLDQGKEKASQPLYAAVVRVAARSVARERSWELVRRIGHVLDVLGNPLGNELIALDNDGYDDEQHAADVPLRRCRRNGMILNSNELAALVHPPTPAVQTSKLKRRVQRSRPAANAALGQGIFLGNNEHAGRIRRVCLNREQRVRHMHVIGASGTGKSTFLLNLILQDIRDGEGVAVLDPHGDLVDAVLDRMPEHRAGDVVLFDPSDEAFPVGFNILAAHSETEKALLSSDLVGIFRRLSSSWGDQMNAVLANAVLAFLESDRGGTLADVRRFLVEKPFREEFLQTVRDSHIVYYWRKEFPMLVAKPQGPVLTRLDAFLRPRPIRHMVAQKANRLDFADIMDSGKIFLARMAHGAIGEENTYLLGSLLVSKFNQLALGRQQVKESQRRHFWLYVDEFQHFATPSMASLLSGVRKYRLGLILAHQELHQLESRSPEVASAVLSNCYTRVCFRVGDHDARKLKEGFSSFTTEDFQNLSTGEAICRVERADFDFNLKALSVAPVTDLAAAAQVREKIIISSRHKYAVPRQVVEAELLQQSEIDLSDPSPAPKRSPKPQILVSPVEIKPSIAPVAPPIPSPAVQIAPDTSTTSPGSDKPRPRKTRKEVVPPEEVLLGRGGPEHKYIQQLIKQWGDGIGFRSTIERSILDGEGSIDVALEKPGLSIACQVSITTTDDWELNGIRKCLKAGFAPVMTVSSNEKHLSRLRKAIDPVLTETERQQVYFVSPAELFAHVQELEINSLKQERTVRGYKVKTTYTPLDISQTDDRRQQVSRVVAQALKRLQMRK